MYDASSAQFLLAQKFETFRTAINIAMLWWVSVVVFLGTCLGGIVYGKDTILQLPHKYVNRLWWIICSFVVSIIIFGVLLIVYSCITISSINPLLSKLDASATMFRYEFICFAGAMFFGISSFILAIIFLISIRLLLKPNDNNEQV